MGQELEQHGVIIEAKGSKSFKKGGGSHQCQVLQRSGRMRIRKKPLNLAIRRSLVSFEKHFRWYNGDNDGNSQIMVD